MYCIVGASSLIWNPKLKHIKSLYSQLYSSAKLRNRFEETMNSCQIISIVNSWTCIPIIKYRIDAMIPLGLYLSES